MIATSYIPQWIRPHLRFLPTIALFAGFIFDAFTLNRPDAWFENIVILGYLLLSAAAILALQARKDSEDENVRLLLLGALQFSFGNLTSALLILYAHSGTLAGNAIFMGMLAALLIGNEMFRSRYARTHLRVLIWFILMLTYSTLIVPVVLSSIETYVFIISVAVALGVITFLIGLLSAITRASFARTRRNIFISIIAVTVTFIALYANHLIPPVPLALKHIGIYHSVVRDGTTYSVTYEKPEWYMFWRDTNEVFHTTPGTPTFCVTAVFAPSKLKTEIRHVWEKYDPATETWRMMARIPFAITGGRAEGFRGYTQTSQIDQGTWRCSVETSRGALIGRTPFIVENGVPELTETEI